MQEILVPVHQPSAGGLYFGGRAEFKHTCKREAMVLDCLHHRISKAEWFAE